MDNKITVFENTEFGTIRATTLNGEPWFVGKDVAEKLGYIETAKAIREHVCEEDKGVSVLDTPGGPQKMTVINESGLYSLILSSKLPGARKFKRWVTAEVLPAIRRNGLYASDELLNDPDLAIAAFTALKEERERNRALSAEAAARDRQIAELTPKASYCDVVLQCGDALPISVIAKDHGWSARKMNRYLHGRGVQYRQGDTWLLYQKYAEQGYTKTKTLAHPAPDGTMHISVHTYWTQQGRLFLYDLLRSDGILPRMEEANQNGDQ